MLKLSDRGFRGTLMDMLKTIVLEQMSSIIRETEILKMNQKEMLEIKNISKSLWWSHKYNRLDRVRKKISDFEDRSIEIPKLKCKYKNNNDNKKQNI